MKITGRLLAGAVGILLVAVVMVVWTSRSSIHRALVEDLERALTIEAEMVQDALGEYPGTWPQLVGHWAAIRGHSVTLFDSAGVALADNHIPPAQLDLPSQRDLPEIRAAIAGRVGRAERADPGEPASLYVAIPGVPVVRVGQDLTMLEAAAGRTQRAMLGAGTLAILLGAILAFLAGRTLTGPLRQLAIAARGLPAGGAIRLPRSGIAEIDQLSQALRQTQQELEARFEALQHERAESEALVNAMVEGVIASDARGRVITANPAARRLLGYGEAGPIPDLPRLFRAKAARDVVDATLSGTAVLDRELILDGRSLLVNSRPLPNGGAVLVLHDVSEIKRLEAVRRDFVANVSHELKTPLTSISGYAETLLTEDPDTDTRRQFLRTIITNAQRMHRLVDDQLDLARVESGRWQPVPRLLDVAASVRDAWAPRATAAAGAGIRLVVQPGPGAGSVRADPEALRQILGNLFDNAIRYTPEGGSITCWSLAEEGGTTVGVSDTGAGIPGEHLPRIFERFYRVDPARSREAGGTGLGLAIVKHLVEGHGGRVRAESELGRGTTIRLWLPA
ncbi:MAG TPA: ATP-binding protein [Gemmatimonadales bacterium]